MGRVGTVGLDLARNVFQVQGADVSGAVIFRKKAAAIASACVFLKPASCSVAMEVCAAECGPW